MKKIVTTAVFSVLLSACSQHSATEHHPHWGYHGDTSPAHWGTLAPEFATCATGHLQSPVNLSSKAKRTKADLQYHYSAVNYVMENNGHTLQLTPQSKIGNLTLNGKLYTLQQFHVHTPSEHTLDNKAFPMELHFVHTSEDGEISVVAVMFEQGKENPHLVQILAQTVKAGDNVALSEAINVRNLFPKDLAHLRLKGSLTTPPCTEGVNWIVMEKPLQASAAQLRAMEKMIGMQNNRPLQALGDRIVLGEK
ncbi:carbonic anhydrase [Testudinibacter sp. P80/BLE/0925]|uniref:carbonic anhydrase n=1 Tax=Testudinibacter sp. TW-1 TaxID=3417757 RepID=UPI003D3685D9